jgi:hypothetical protein
VVPLLSVSGDSNNTAEGVEMRSLISGLFLPCNRLAVDEGGEEIVNGMVLFW